MSGHIQGTTEALESASATDAAGDLEKWIGDMPELIDQNAAVFDKYMWVLALMGRRGCG